MCIHNASVHSESRAYSRTHSLAPFSFSLFQVTIDDGAMHSSTLLCQVKVIRDQLMLILYVGLFKMAYITMRVCDLIGQLGVICYVELDFCENVIIIQTKKKRHHTHRKKKRNLPNLPSFTTI
ncbi:hypothetical protein RHGRI_024485 [Rhododendron griersonianum]|uniref:Uncharacterized protein n=1 Tax=Rhododendron griersonianum TaxID=479676 RepID=A0AAV6JCJ1_9ERIC|nr:hypothetical protein RHGRI_024485 [Rhododendron griersonianum]